MAGSFRAGVDIGGTFTDIVLLGDSGERYTKKVSSTVDDYARAIVDGLAALLAEIGAEPRGDRRTAARHDGRVERDPRTQGRQDRADHDQGVPRRARNPQSAHAAALRHVVDQAAAAGRAPPAGRGRRAGQRPRRHRPAARRGERRARRALSCRRGGRGDRGLPAALLPEPGARDAGQGDRGASGARRHACRSAPRCLPVINEYERSSTTVINAYVRPIVERYLNRLDRRGAGAPGSTAPLLLMQSNGGLTTAKAAAVTPMHIIESGPAAGVVGVQALTRRIGIDKAISFDMGGTTAKASLIENGEFTRATEYQVGAGIVLGSRLLSGAGYTLKVPAIDLAEVGAGGGSILWIDSRRRVADRAAQRRRGAGAGMLRPGRHRADRDRRQCRARLHQSGASGRRRAEARRGQGARRRSPSRIAGRSA